MSKPPIPERLSIITTTHLLTSAPSTLVFRKALDRARKYLPIAGCRHLVYYDQPAGQGAREEQYRANLAKMADDYGLELYVRPNSGLKLNLIEGINAVTTPYALFLEHDWAFRKPVALEALLDVFDKYDHVNHVRFNMRRNDAHYMFDHFSVGETRIPELPLTMTSSWSNQAHVVRVSKWREDWLARIGPAPSTKSFGVEEVLYTAYNRDIFTKGFYECHPDWGCYIYGGYHEAPFVYHINGSVVKGPWWMEYPSKAWRRAKRLVRGYYPEGRPEYGDPTSLEGPNHS